MNNFESMIIAVFGSLLVRLIALVAIPALLLLAAKALWSACPRWIPCVIGATAIIRFLTSIPALLLHPLVQQWVGGIGMQQYSKLAIAAAIMNWPVAIGFPIAILALARQMKQKTEHASGA